MNKVFHFPEFSNFSNLSNCKAPRYFLMSFLEIVISMGCLGGISQSLIFSKLMKDYQHGFLKTIYSKNLG